MAEEATNISANLFKHQYITTELPDRANSRYGTPALADFDRDGDLDYAFSIAADQLFWFEFKNGEWIRHRAGPVPTSQLAGNVHDIDKDGWIDIVIGGAWFRNPQSPRQDPFTVFSYDDRIRTEIHDLVLADIDGDSSEDVIVLGDREGCFWYSIPANPSEKANWPRIEITLSVLDQNDDIHAGFFPRGIGDLDRDGDADVVMPDRWYENQNRGRKWIKRSLPWGKVGPWGLSSRSWIVDFNQDGHSDIVIVDCDQSGSRGAWLESDGASPPNFEVHLLPQPAQGVRGSFHSLAVVDFDLDGDLDVFTLEQQDHQILPEGAPPRGYIWENLDGKAGLFKERIVFDSRLGGHDALTGDIDGDGDVDICFKVWMKWPDSRNGGTVHADCLVNELK
jgi:hypothetical protein